MKACEATPMELLALKERVQRKEYRPELHQPKNWPGTEERDLWIDVLNRKNHVAVFQADNDQLIRALDRAEKKLPEASGEQPWAPSPKEEADRWPEGVAFGMALGILISMAAIYLGTLL